MAEQQIQLRDSSNIRSALYDPDTLTLTVGFKSGGTYAYSGVSVDKAQAFADADSHGSFLHSQIKGQHTFTKIG